MIRPDVLKKNEPLKWSPGMGNDVWELFCACITGDLTTVKCLVGKDPSIVRSHYAYRTPIYFAVRENQVEVVAFLLKHGADPLSLAVNDSLLDICRDRGHMELGKLLGHISPAPRAPRPREKPSHRRSVSAIWKKCEACLTPHPSFCMQVMGDPISRSTGP
jgi:hypothetical protein